MTIEIKKKERESAANLLYRFSKKIRQSGLLKEVKKRQYKKRKENKRKIRLAALHRLKKEKEIEKAKKMG